ncbi:RICIN domain-containing protein, partial [Rhizobium johnstonii]|uniref:RICIN domain-containing protein n=1 Tax=Rhizobium johnstonii TaxID=3019933 RepID=UPI003F96158C
NPLETYTFAVAAIDAAGNESPKKTVTVTTATPVSTQYYRILNDKSGQCLDVYQANTGNTELIQWPCKTTGTENQEWEFTASESVEAPTIDTHMFWFETDLNW